MENKEEIKACASCEHCSIIGKWCEVWQHQTDLYSTCRQYSKLQPKNSKK